MSSPGRELLLSRVDEATFQRQVETWATRAGWLAYHTRNSFGSAKGFPDLVLARARTGEVVYAELKTEKGKVTPSQQVWIEALQACGQRVYVWRPSDEALVKSVLGVAAGVAA